MAGYNWLGTILDWLGFVPDEPIGDIGFFGIALTEPDPVGHPVKVARVSFTYQYPTILAALAGTYLSPGSMGNRSLTFPVYQACAAPIEPVPEGPMALAEARIDMSSEDEAEDNLERTRELERAINHALDGLHLCIEEIRKTIERDRFDRSRWPTDPPWEKASPDRTRPGVVRINPREHWTLQEGDAAFYALQESYASIHELGIQNEIIDWSRDNDKWLFDPYESLRADNDYRKNDVMVWIEMERKALREEISDVQKTETESVVHPHGVGDALGREPVSSVARHTDTVPAGPPSS